MIFLFKVKYRWLFAGLFVFISSCSLVPTYHHLSGRFGFSVEKIEGDLFQHVVFYKSGVGRVLHVYIEGDGRPWKYKNQVSLDPTPRHVLMMELMALDDAPAIYLGRPCYFEQSSPCSPIWWTHRRYSESVVNSMAVALEHYSGGYESVALIGHSGGGALAMLLAERIDNVQGVITLAANLDIEKWALFHGYSPLEGSLNPALRPPLSAKIKQRHYVAEDDRNIQAQWLDSVINRQPDAKLIKVKGDHSCCWMEQWNDILWTLKQ